MESGWWSGFVLLRCGQSLFYVVNGRDKIARKTKITSRIHQSAERDVSSRSF